MTQLQMSKVKIVFLGNILDDILLLLANQNGEIFLVYYDWNRKCELRTEELRP